MIATLSTLKNCEVWGILSLMLEEGEGVGIKKKKGGLRDGERGGGDQCMR